jgi:glycosyltransferase involved in cell wall biosynthesis
VYKRQEIVYYAHSLPHELFDQKREYMKKVLFFFHEFYSIAFWVRKMLYKYELRHVDKILTNSKVNQKWLMEWSGRNDIEVLYPPVNMLRYRASKEKTSFMVQEHNNVESVLEREVHDYYVSFARLTIPKRIDRIIHAFIHMPEKNLIVLYNPFDKDREFFMQMARGYNNIFFHHEPNDIKLVKIISSAVASIAVSKSEDFGMVAIESMACGIPVIAVDEGGYKETVIHGKTGVLLPAEFSVYDLMSTIEVVTPKKSLTMKEDCIKRANEFSLEGFMGRIRHTLENI